MRKAIWTLVTQPPDLATAVRLDQNMAKVSVQLFMPLSLQLSRKKADVRPAIKLRALLLWRSVDVTVDRIGMACRSACMC